MARERLVIRISGQEKRVLSRQAENFGFSLTEYVRRKLFDENDDLIKDEGKYVSPHIEKHNLVNVTMLYKVFYLVVEILKSQENIALDKVIEAEEQALDYARKEREKYGYNYIKREQDT